MRKYIGTSTISNITKKTKRSRLRKTPRQPASRRSSQARKGFSSWWAGAPTMASGNRSPVITRRKREIPSTPRCQEMSRSEIQVTFSTIWKSAAPASKATRAATVSAPVSTEKARATTRHSSGRRFETSATASAPTAGSTTMADSSGKDVAPSEAARITGPPPAAGARRRRRRRRR
jgi:hypothetical protein